MYRILKIGMDVHTTNFTLYALESKFGEEDQILANITVGLDHKNVLDFIRRIKRTKKRSPSAPSKCPQMLSVTGFLTIFGCSHFLQKPPLLPWRD